LCGLSDITLTMVGYQCTKNGSNDQLGNITLPSILKSTPVQLNWTAKHSVPIKYCLAQPVEEKCHLGFSSFAMIFVIIFNFVKVACLWIIVWQSHVQSTDFRPILTLGDAIQTFLEKPDQTVKGLCVAGTQDFSRASSLIPIFFHKQLINWSRTTTLSWAERRNIFDSRRGKRNVVLENRPSHRWWFRGASASRWLVIALHNGLNRVLHC